MTNWATIATNAEITARMGTLEQDLEMASPAVATAETKTATVNILGVPVVIAGTTKWATELPESGITSMQVATAIGIMAAVGALIAAVVVLAKSMM